MLTDGYYARRRAQLDARLDAIEAHAAECKSHFAILDKSFAITEHLIPLVRFDAPLSADRQDACAASVEAALFPQVLALAAE